MKGHTTMNVNEKKQALDLQATITTQAQTIERLADALEFALAFANYPSNLKKREAEVRALLAEIRGAK